MFFLQVRKGMQVRNSDESWNTKWQFDGELFDGSISLQDWYSIDRESHTPLLDEGDEACDGSGEGLQSPDIDRDPTWSRENKSTETDSCLRWSWTSSRMCKLSETGEWWTSLSTSHDEQIMTAIAKSKARARCNAVARCHANFCEHWPTPKLAITFSPRVLVDDRETRRFSEAGCGWTRTDALNCFQQTCFLRSVDSSAFAHESCMKCSPRERRSVKNHIRDVDSQTVHDVHTNTVSFSHQFSVTHPLTHAPHWL